MSEVVRLFCPECGKSCGRVERDGITHVYVGILHAKMNGVASKRQVRQDLRLWTEQGIELPVSCPGGHWLVLDPSQLKTALHSRLVLLPSRHREREATNGLDRYGRGTYHETERLWDRYDLPE